MIETLTAHQSPSAVHEIGVGGTKRASLVGFGLMTKLMLLVNGMLLTGVAE